MAGLDALEAGNSGDTGEDAMLGGLGAYGGDQRDPFAAASEKLLARPPLTTNAVDKFAQGYRGAPPSLDELRAQAQETYKRNMEAVDRMRHPPINEGLPYFKMAAGLLKPTKTGSFGESFGSGLDEFSGALGAQEKERIAAQNAAEMAGIHAGTGNFDEQAKIFGLDTAARRTDLLLRKADDAMMMTAPVKNWMFANGYTADDYRNKLIPPAKMAELNALIGTKERQNAIALVDPSHPDYQNTMQAIVLGPIKQRVQANVIRSLKDAQFTTAAEQDAEIRRRTDVAMKDIGLNPRAAVAAYNDPVKADTLGLTPIPAPASSAESLRPVAAPGAPVAAPAAAPSNTLMKGSPALELQQSAAKELGKTQTEFENGLADTAQNATAMNRTLQEMKEAINDPASKPGGFAQVRALISKYKVMLGIDTPDDRAQIANYELSDKIGGQLVAGYLKSVTARPSQMEFLMAQSKYIPNMLMTANGANKVLDILQQANNIGVQEAKEYFSWKKQHPNGDHREFMLDWMDKVSKMPMTLSGAAPTGVPLPEGVPAGSKLIGHAKGSTDEVWQAPDGGKHRVTK